MTNNIIKLLPDHVANQIAAGEVIQRPASVVKELLENSIDAGAGKIQLLIKEAGKSLIQVIDDGSGMGESDARMCFERHATSKISSADDLFNLSTKGFRGEALASIAAIAHVELKSKLRGNELGNKLVIEGSIVQTNEACSVPVGTSLAIKNLFYNIPARRKFLKSNAIETKHIIEEFQRVAFVHPSIEFILINNDQEIFHLESGNFRKRIVDIMGKNYNNRLVPVHEETDIVNISGFVGKPEFAKKVRGEQYFFVNNRFIKNYNLQHAISLAYDELLPKGAHPSFFINIDVNPQDVDINIHPTKTEVKFEDERSIFAILKSTVKQSLSKYAISPSLDFDQETSFNVDPLQKDQVLSPPSVNVNRDFNPFEKSGGQKESSWQRGDSFKQDNYSAPSTKNWESLFDDNNREDEEGALDDYTDFINSVNFEKEKEQSAMPFSNNSENDKIAFIHQIQNRYILTNSANGIFIIHQRRAHERVLFEYFLESLEKTKRFPQQLLFPETIELSPSNFEILNELLPDLAQLGFDINLFGKNTFVINGTPSDIPDLNSKETIEHLLEQYQLNESDFKAKKNFFLAKNMASKIAIQPEQKMQQEEMQHLIEQLLNCKQPTINPAGKSVIFELKAMDLIQYFGN